jgi:hypothetical protein
MEAGVEAGPLISADDRLPGPERSKFRQHFKGGLGSQILHPVRVAYSIPLGSARQASPRRRGQRSLYPNRGRGARRPKLFRPEQPSCIPPVDAQVPALTRSRWGAKVFSDSPPAKKLFPAEPPGATKPFTDELERPTPPPSHASFAPRLIPAECCRLISVAARAQHEASGPDRATVVSRTRSARQASRHPRR